MHCTVIIQDTRHPPSFIMCTLQQQQLHSLLLPVQKEGTLSPYKSSLVKTVRQPEVVTLTEADVQRMKSEARVMTAEERNTLRHAIEERKEHERAAAKARKEKMLSLQAEAKQQVRKFVNVTVKQSHMGTHALSRHTALRQTVCAGKIRECR
jgi:hypothetical protein